MVMWSHNSAFVCSHSWDNGPNLLVSRTWSYKVTWHHQSHDDSISNMLFSIVPLEPSFYVPASILNRFRDICTHMYLGHEIDLSGSSDIQSHDHLIAQLSLPIGAPLSSAAFDTIDHKIFINRLSDSFGISGSVLGWLTSYLSNRSQLVRVGQAQSSLTHCTSGVPQG